LMAKQTRFSFNDLRDLNFESAQDLA